MQLRGRIILNWEMADVRAIFNSAVETSLLELLGMLRVGVYRNSTLVSGQDLLAVLKRYPTFTSCQNAACSNTFFSLWRVDYALEGFMFWLTKCDFSHLFHTERSWHAYCFPVIFEFLVGTICSLMQEHFLWPLSKGNALSCGSTSKAFRSFIFVQSVSRSE